MDSVDGAKGVQVSSDESFSIDCDSCEYNQISSIECWQARRYLHMTVLPSNVGKHREVSSDESFAIECGQAPSLYPMSYHLSILKLAYSDVLTLNGCSFYLGKVTALVHIKEWKKQNSVIHIR